MQLDLQGRLLCPAALDPLALCIGFSPDPEIGERPSQEDQGVVDCWYRPDTRRDVGFGPPGQNVLDGVYRQHLEQPARDRKNHGNHDHFQCDVSPDLVPKQLVSKGRKRKTKRFDDRGQRQCKCKVSENNRTTDDAKHGPEEPAGNLRPPEQPGRLHRRDVRSAEFHRRLMPSIASAHDSSQPVMTGRVVITINVALLLAAWNGRFID